MDLILFGASGTIGQRILNEALDRGHSVTAVARDPSRITQSSPQLKIVRGDVLDPENVAALASGHEAIISAVGPGKGDPHEVVAAARSLTEAMQKLPGVRLIVVGGAGSLRGPSGTQLVDAPDFPPAWKPAALAHREALDIFEHSDSDWTYLSPAAVIEPGERTGKYRTGTDHLLVDEKGDSRISTEDYAVALLDELEKPKFKGRRFTVAY
jgi:putative NADH-flavin reductase